MKRAYWLLVVLTPLLSTVASADDAACIAAGGTPRTESRLVPGYLSWVTNTWVPEQVITEGSCTYPGASITSNGITIGGLPRTERYYATKEDADAAVNWIIPQGNAQACG
jgi:hypothetical protein